MAGGTATGDVELYAHMYMCMRMRTCMYTGTCTCGDGCGQVPAKHIDALFDSWDSDGAAAVYVYGVYIISNKFDSWDPDGAAAVYVYGVYNIYNTFGSIPTAPPLVEAA